MRSAFFNVSVKPTLPTRNCEQNVGIGDGPLDRFQSLHPLITTLEVQIPSAQKQTQNPLSPDPEHSSLLITRIPPLRLNAIWAAKLCNKKTATGLRSKNFVLSTSNSCQPVFTRIPVHPKKSKAPKPDPTLPIHALNI